MSKKDAGRIGGLATYRKYGREYMSEIGRKGAMEFHKRYKLEPLNMNDFAIVYRETGVPIGKTLRGLVIGVNHEDIYVLCKGER